MLQTMTAQIDKKKYPTISARVPKDFEKKFDDLLKFVQRDHPTLDKPMLVRMILGSDTRIPIKQEWRDYLMGLRDTPALHGEFLPIAKSAKKPKTGSD